MKTIMAFSDVINHIHSLTIHLTDFYHPDHPNDPDNQGGALHRAGRAAPRLHPGGTHRLPAAPRPKQLSESGSVFYKFPQSIILNALYQVGSTNFSL